MIMELKTGYYHKGIIFTNFRKIWKKYKKDSMKYDLISLVTLIFNFFKADEDAISKIVELLIFFKIISCLMIIETVKS